MQQTTQSPDSPPLPHGGRYASARVLVVDDETDIAEQVCRILRLGLRCEVERADTGEAAVARLRDQHFDLIITDMRMPGTHGLHLVYAYREARPGASIVVMTGYPVDFPFVDVTKAGAEDIISKPFMSEELQAKAIRILEARIERHQRKMAERKYKSLFELSIDGMLLLEHAERRVVDVNPTFCEMTGRAPDAVLGSSVLDLFDAADRGRFNIWLDFCAQAGRGMLGDLTLLHADGSPRGVDITATFIEFEGESLIFLQFKDVTERREVARRLVDAAQRDELTGMYNKRSFQTRIEDMLDRARDGRLTALSLLLIDLDNFKACNDNHGHQAGDAVLKLVGGAIHGSIRHGGGDVGFRFGGDEFAVLLEGARREEAMIVAGRIREHFTREETYGTTMSIGLAVYTRDMDSGELIRQADAALYQAKGAGKNTIHVA